VKLFFLPIVGAGFMPARFPRCDALVGRELIPPLLIFDEIIHSLNENAGLW